MIVLALDAMDLNMVKRYKCENLMQSEHGQTSLSEFQLERTVVLWASFLTGRNMESKIPLETQWEFKLKPEETFFPFFRTYEAIDVPAFSLKEGNHAEERRLLKEYFEGEATVEEYDAVIWRNHEENREDFFDSMDTFDLLMGYFDLADAIGHLSFGINGKMKQVYIELENMTRQVKSSSEEPLLIISDHGMKPVGKYGDHSRNGFYSANFKLGLDLPRITGFYNIIKGVASNEPS